jgi:single-strand DNA-binding protein
LFSLDFQKNISIKTRQAVAVTGTVFLNKVSTIIRKLIAPILLSVVEIVFYGGLEMSSFNKVIIMGRLTRSVELRTTSRGHSVVDLGIAVNERCPGDNGEWVDVTQFVDVTFWNRKAEVIAQYFQMGSPILIEGSLQLDRWEKEGKNLSKLKVRGTNFSFVGNKTGTNVGELNAESEPELAGTMKDDDIPF